MKKFLLPLLLVLTTAAFSQTVNPAYQDGKIWFKLKNNVRLDVNIGENPMKIEINSMPYLAAIAKSHSITSLQKPFHAAQNSEILQRTYQINFSDIQNVDLFVEQLKADAHIEYAEKVPYDQLCLTPNDYNSSTLWHLQKINATGAWNYFSTGSTIRVAVVDNAVQTTHTDLTANIFVNPSEIPSNGIDDDGNGYIDDINGWDASDNDNNPNPPNTTFDHGTHCAGLVSASTNNGIGICGIGYSVKVIGVKATSNSGSPTSITDGYAGITYAVAAKAKVISLSWGGTASSTTAQNIITWAYGQNAIIVAAAGNSNVNTLFYPAAYTNVIAVASSDNTDAKSSFSNYGNWIDVTAPGSNIYSTIPTNAYAYMSGTSMACPLTAGLIGLMRSLSPSLPASNVITCLTSTCDNINAMNPSYIGQLGAGRINANNAMSCISATLNLPPQANFVANVTTVPAGSNITYTDQTIFNPTTWAWTFPGGTPASFNGQNPPAITYNTPGVYNASLTATNSHGTSTFTRTNYITVTAGVGCDTVNLPLPITWTPTNYYVTATPTYSNGWVNGVNNIADKEKAMYFNESSFPYTYMEGVFIAFGKAWSNNSNKIVPVRVYDGTSGTPGAQIGTANLTMGQIMFDCTNHYYTRVIFTNPIALPVSKKFFVSVDLTNLTWVTSPKDTLNIVSNVSPQTSPSDTWDKNATNVWHQYNTPGTWPISISLLIHPIITNAPVIATYTTTPSTSICAGNSYSFNAAGSTYQDTILWIFQGGSPSTSNSVTPTVIYNTPGTYTVKLYVVGGGCDMLDSMVTTVTIKPNPTVGVSATPSTICPLGTSALVASGGTSYLWTPATNLSCTTCANPTATPTTTTSYNVTVTGANGCSAISSVTINVNQPPVPTVTVGSTNICINTSLTWDASASSNATTFNWTFGGGTPPTSTNAVQTVLYSTAGPFTTALTISNSCSSNNTYTHAVSVACVGIDEPNMDDHFSSYFNSSTNSIVLSASQLQSNEELNINIISSLGQIVYSGKLPVSGGGVNATINVGNIASGIYYLQVMNSAVKYRADFFKGN